MMNNNLIELNKTDEKTPTITNNNNLIGEIRIGKNNVPVEITSNAESRIENNNNLVEMAPNDINTISKDNSSQSNLPNTTTNNKYNAESLNDLNGWLVLITIKGRSNVYV